MEKYDIEPYNQERYLKEEAYLRAKKRVEKLIGFYWHFAVYLIVNLFIICIIYFNSDQHLFSFGIWATAIFWGIGLLFHFLGVFGPHFMFGKNWEEKKIKEFMDKDKMHWE